MSKNSEQRKRRVRRKRRPNPLKDTLGGHLWPGMTESQLGIGLLLAGAALLFPEILNQPAKLCACPCHMPRFDSLPEECRCPDPIGKECQHFGRLYDIHGVQNFCHKCECLRGCGK